jgi:hypothetical protein
VQIHLAQRPTMSNEQLEYLITGARTEAAKHADRAKFDLQHRGELVILDRRSVGDPIVLPGADEKFAGDTSPEYRWTINVFVPRGKEMLQYELNFLALTQNRFNADQAFLESILSTVDREGAAPATTQPADKP